MDLYHLRCSDWFHHLPARGCDAVLQRVDYAANQHPLEVYQYKQVIPFNLVVKNPKLVMINWKFGNHCNLACRMCNSGSSSQFNKILVATTLGEDKTSKDSVKWRLEKFNMIIDSQ